MRVYILDPVSESLNQVLNWLLEKENIEEVIIYKEPTQFARRIAREQPELIFVRIGNCNFSGLSVGKMIKSMIPYIKLVFIANEGDYALDAHEIGADGYLVCPIKKDKLDKLNII